MCSPRGQAIWVTQDYAASHAAKGNPPRMASRPLLLARAVSEASRTCMHSGRIDHPMAHPDHGEAPFERTQLMYNQLALQMVLTQLMPPIPVRRNSTDIWTTRVSSKSCVQNFKSLSASSWTFRVTEAAGLGRGRRVDTKSRPPQTFLQVEDCQQNPDTAQP